MLWLFGPAGTGKSAIAQPFAQTCFEMGRLGAALFFSRPNGRDKLETVVPSFVYHLCACCPAYKFVIAKALASDPHLVKKATAVQFKQLLIEPLSRLRAGGHESVRKPFLVLLDGLDECPSGRAQHKFIKLISDHVRIKPGFPILWLLCSRPEPHLKHAFLRIPECGREELLLDNESREDVEHFLRESFAKIKDDDPYTTSSDWPPAKQFEAILDICDGLFQVAAVCTNYVATSHSPVPQLDSLVNFCMHTQRVRGDNPLAAMDLLYTQIMSDILGDVLPNTMQILARLLHHLLLPGYYKPDLPYALVLCNVLQFKQSTFYTALSNLHSVLKIPTPDNAAQSHLVFYHVSFLDFLLDPSRSGRFVLKQEWAFETVTGIFAMA